MFAGNTSVITMCSQEVQEVPICTIIMYSYKIQLYTYLELDCHYGLQGVNTNIYMCVIIIIMCSHEVQEVLFWIIIMFAGVNVNINDCNM